jgi:hypothetical protein
LALAVPVNEYNVDDAEEIAYNLKEPKVSVLIYWEMSWTKLTMTISAGIYLGASFGRKV